MVCGGSSPRMRGARVLIPALIPRPGIIPAYAGSTLYSFMFLPFLGDHPRVCGEHSIALSLTLRFLGSSPRMRGARVLGVAAHDEVGIIPAYAGSTPRASAPGASSWDHPRVCGEHEWHSDVVTAAQGSSPRMRGALHLLGLHALALGIIPAYAGSTPSLSVT